MGECQRRKNGWNKKQLLQVTSEIPFKVVIFKFFIKRGIHSATFQTLAGWHIPLSYFGITKEAKTVKSWLCQNVLKATPNVLALGVTAWESWAYYVIPYPSLFSLSSNLGLCKYLETLFSPPFIFILSTLKSLNAN